MQQLIGTNLGQYHLIEVIGGGAAATVYRAYQPSLRRYVAVKVLRPNSSPEFATRFRRESHAIAQLQHPHILPIYDSGEEGGMLYFVMLYIEHGTNLGDMISKQGLEPQQVIELAVPLLDALGYAHRQGVIHRDIKPSNILMFRPDWPLLADFGIAKSANESRQLTPPGMAIGTATYMAPELGRTLTATPRADLYAVGVTLYEMATGRVPFEGATPLAVLLKHINDLVPPPRGLHPDLPLALEGVILRALEKDPDRRFQTAEEMGAALAGALAQIRRQQGAARLQQMLAARAAPIDPYQTIEIDQEDEPATSIHTQPTQSLPQVVSTPSTSHTTRRATIAFVLVIGALLIGLLALSGLSFGGAAGLAGRSGAIATPRYTREEGGQRSGAPAPAPAPTEELAQPTTQPPPTDAPLPVSTDPSPPAPTAAPPVRAEGEQVVALEDNVWMGGYGGAARRRSYGGRTATWVYGTATEYSTMRATFELPSQPVGEATLVIEGMDSEDAPKTPMSISVNGVEMYSGPNPLPNDDQPLATGTWASERWSFDATLLRAGQNEIVISNRAGGAFGLPPFVMIDYCEVIYSSSSPS